MTKTTKVLLGVLALVAVVVVGVFATNPETFQGKLIIKTPIGTLLKACPYETPTVIYDKAENAVTQDEIRQPFNGFYTTLKTLKDTTNCEYDIVSKVKINENQRFCEIENLNVSRSEIEFTEQSGNFLASIIFKTPTGLRSFNITERDISVKIIFPVNSLETNPSYNYFYMNYYGKAYTVYAHAHKQQP